jgi:NAD+ diphosphatase
VRQDGRVPYADDLLRDVPLATAGLDRCAHRRTEPGLIATLLSDPDTLVLPVCDGHAPVAGPAGPELAWRAPGEGDAAYPAVFLGSAAGRARVAVLVPRADMDATWLGLRVQGADLGPIDAEAFTTAVALGNWHATHTHCPRCGSPTQIATAGWTRRCPEDRSEHFPRTDPAVIMAVVDPDDRLLLARHPTWPAGRLSVLAGFVEPGESLEMAVCREVREEVGLMVRDVRYLGDQPWPFPNSLMLGFEARTDDPTLAIDEAEIAEAFWLTRADYHALVDEGAWGGGTALSISRRLILRWLHG